MGSSGGADHIKMGVILNGASARAGGGGPMCSEGSREVQSGESSK